MGTEDNNEEYEGGKIKDSDIYRFKVGEQIGRVMEAGSKDIVNDDVCMREYQRSVNALEIILAPYTGLIPWDESRIKDKSYPSIIKFLKDSGGIEGYSDFDLKAMALMIQLPKIGLVPPKNASDEDIGDTDDYRAWAKHRFGLKVYESKDEVFD